MKSYRNRMLTMAALALAAIGVCAGPAAAQAPAAGKFTLPFEVKWQGALVPAGEYTFTLMSPGQPARLMLQGPKGTMLIGAVTTDVRRTKTTSALTVQRVGGTRFVQEMYLACLDRAIIFRVPKISKEEQARGPVTTEQVLVAMAR